jgi:diguanylate cyclase (GGDEF)-like protein
METTNTICRRLPYAAFAHVGGMFLVAGVYWGAGDRFLLLSGPVILSVIYFVLIRHVRKLLAKAQPETTVWDAMRGPCFAAVLGSLTGLMLAQLIPASQTNQLMSMGGINSALIAGSVFVAEWPSVAFAFLIPVWLGVLCGTLQRIDLPSPKALGCSVYVAVVAFQILILYRRHQLAANDRAALREHREVIGVLLSDFEDNANDWLWEVDANGYFLRVSERMAHVTGAPPTELTKKSFFQQLKQCAAGSGPDVASFERLIQALELGRPFRNITIPMDFGMGEVWATYSGKPISGGSGNIVGYRGVGSDVTAIRASYAEIEHLSNHDSLTKLPNRNSFMRALGDECQKSLCVSVIAVDLDGFKAINDTYGHAMGDRLLQSVASTMRLAVRATDIVARIVGDEFAILLPGAGPDSAIQISSRMIIGIKKPIEIDGITLRVGASAGIAVAEEPHSDPNKLLRGADLALYSAKSAAPGAIRVFDARMDEAARLHDQLLLDLRCAFEQQAFELQFQPIVDIKTGHVAAVEALVRWNHPDHGFIPPARFIPLAEESGLIRELGAWVIRAACQSVVYLPGSPKICINISAIQVKGGTLFSDTVTALRESKLSPTRLEYELTESIFLDFDEETRSSLNSLRSLDVRIALDGFGAGHSSLSYLQHWQFDTIKIDKALLRGISRQKNNAFLSAIIKMAQQLDINITAQGIETSWFAYSPDARCTHAGFTSRCRRAFSANATQTLRARTAIGLAQTGWAPDSQIRLGSSTRRQPQRPRHSGRQVPGRTGARRANRPWRVAALAICHHSPPDENGGTCPATIGRQNVN